MHGTQLDTPLGSDHLCAWPEHVFDIGFQRPILAETLWSRQAQFEFTSTCCLASIVSSLCDCGKGRDYINQNAGPDGFKSNLGSLSLSYLLGLSDFSKHFQRSLLSTCATNKPLTSFGAGQIQTHSRISMQSSNIQCIKKKSSMLKELWNKRK